MNSTRHTHDCREECVDSSEKLVMALIKAQGTDPPGEGLVSSLKGRKFPEKRAV